MKKKISVSTEQIRGDIAGKILTVNYKSKLHCDKYLPKNRAPTKDLLTEEFITSFEEIQSEMVAALSELHALPHNIFCATMEYLIIAATEPDQGLILISPSHFKEPGLTTKTTIN